MRLEEMKYDQDWRTYEYKYVVSDDDSSFVVIKIWNDNEITVEECDQIRIQDLLEAYERAKTAHALLKTV